MASAIQVVVGNAYQLIKVMMTEEGKFETTAVGKVLFVSSLSYIVTSIVSLFA